MVLILIITIKYFTQFYCVTDFFIDAQTPDSNEFQSIPGVHQLPYFTSFTLDDNQADFIEPPARRINSNASNDLVIEIEWEETRIWHKLNIEFVTKHFQSGSQPSEEPCSFPLIVSL